MDTFLLILHVLSAVGLIGCVLAQDSKDAGFSAALTGGGNAGEQAYGKRKGKDDILRRLSTSFAVAFIFLSMVLVYRQAL